MVFIREIGTETGALLADRLSVTLQIVIIYVTCSSTIAAPLALYPRARKRQFYSYFLKNRQFSGHVNGNGNHAGEYGKPLVYRDLFLNNYQNERSKSSNNIFPEVKTTDTYTRKNRMPNAPGTRRSFQRADGMKRILSFPLKDGDRGIINGFAPGDPAADCLIGALDAGVVNGALKIGIGVGLAPGCEKSKEPASKLVPVPVFIPRAVPVPQPYPVAIDVPVPIRVPQPVPFPSFGMPMMAGMPPFSGRMMALSRGCRFQNCENTLDAPKADALRPMDSKNEYATETKEYDENTIMPEFRSSLSAVS